MKFVAVTACPTGIAHSQMAAEKLETTPTARGHEITVEVQGAMGAENELPDGDIEAAEATIVAADTAVPMDRFEALPVVKGTVKDAVNDADSLIAAAIDAAGGDPVDAPQASANDETVASAADDAEAQTASSSPADGTRTIDQEALERRREKSLLARVKRRLS
ncbi:fructose PTS transporter subunit IIB [Halobacteria archaeon AArc-dxtr1]|nr:fructose PTS transporter subunit IIB [Halobacteria archaeon AArc-dxtr1]